MTVIVTLTMNPALDIAAATEAVVPTDKLRCTAPRYDPGGGGINVARTIRILGGDALAVFPVGGPAGAMLHDLLDRDGVPHDVIPISGMTRESLTVDERRSGKQYRFVLPGPELTEAEQQQCLDRLASQTVRPRFVVMSGSLPPGVTDDFVGRVARLVHDMGARLVLDTSGAALRQDSIGAYLVKPNLRELQDLVGRELRGEFEQIAAARELINRGLSEIVVVSRGSRGALAVTAERQESFPVIEVPVRSTVGAGDSMVGAMVLALDRGLPLGAAVCFGMTAGAAAVMMPGTEPLRREDAERLFEEMRASGCVPQHIAPQLEATGGAA